MAHSINVAYGTVEETRRLPLLSLFLLSPNSGISVPRSYNLPILNNSALDPIYNGKNVAADILIPTRNKCANQSFNLYRLFHSSTRLHFYQNFSLLLALVSNGDANLLETPALKNCRYVSHKCFNHFLRHIGNRTTVSKASLAANIRYNNKCQQQTYCWVQEKSPQSLGSLVF
jgi:hypothetical protein